jgi:hypothetical protein
MTAVAIISSLSLTLLAVIVGLAKIQRLPASLHVRDQARISPLTWLESGWVEVIAAAGLVVGVFVALELAIAAAIVLLLSFLCLALRQLWVQRSAATALPALGLMALSAVAVASIAVSG